MINSCRGTLCLPISIGGHYVIHNNNPLNFSLRDFRVNLTKNPLTIEEECSKYLEGVPIRIDSVEKGLEEKADLSVVKVLP